MAMADNIVISEMTWTEVDEAMKERPVAILPECEPIKELWTG